MLSTDPLSKGQNYIAMSHYLNLEQHGNIQCEYVWIGGSGLDIRAKTRTLSKKVTNINQIPCWNYDVCNVRNKIHAYK